MISIATRSVTTAIVVFMIVAMTAIIIGFTIASAVKRMRIIHASVY
jgi:hypothetical protein